ncbi:MAG: alpha/beta hydrolase [Candidatus Binataceae bacterium]|nr:alpha/beta hydrolase [Candidatus Binataceae bacterium]
MPQERTLDLWHGQIKPTVRIAGSGAPLVFLHSWFGPVWEPFLDLLARDFTVYAPSLPGTGPGDVDGIKALDDLWDLVLYHYELFDALGLKSPAVVGHSFGGMIAAEVAATDPTRVGKLGLLSPFGLWRDDTPIPLVSAMPPQEIVRRVFNSVDHPATRLMFPNRSDVDAVIRVTWAQNCSNKFIWPIPDKGLKKRIHRITAPTLVVWGKSDNLIPPVYAEEFKSRIGNARIELVNQASHMAPFERPQAVADILVKFLKG